MWMTGIIRCGTMEYSDIDTDSMIPVSGEWNTGNTESGKEWDRERQKGSLTVEALLFLTIFLCAFLTLMNMVNMIRVQALIQYAVNQTAREISEYSYVLSKTGVTGKIQDTGAKSAQFQAETEEVVNSMQEFLNAVGNGDGNAIELGNIAVDNAVDYAENTDIVAGVVNLLKGTAEDMAGMAVVGGIGKGRIRKNLSYMTNNPDGYLKELGVVGGIEGIDFSESRWVSGGEKAVRVTAVYRMESRLTYFNLGEYEFRVNATTLVW